MTDDVHSYDHFAAQYAGLIEDWVEADFSPYHNLVVPALLRQLGPVAELDVLDAGCGHGHVSRLLAATGANVTGIDAAASLIDIARRTESPRSITYLVHDLSQPLPADVGTFDLIVSNLVLNDVADYLGFADTLGQAVKSNGRLVLTLNNPYSAVPRRYVENYFDSGASRPYHGLSNDGVPVLHTHRTLEEYIAAFSQAGFALRYLSDMRPPGELLHLPRPQKYYHFPFFMLLDFLKLDVGC